jgi:hypothetical protein
MHSILTEIKSLSALTVSFQWVPSHCGIYGNDEADRLAKAAHADIGIPIIDTPITQSSMKRNLLKSIISKYDVYWHTVKDSTHLGNIKDSFVSWHRYYLRERHSDVVITRLRLGHSRLRGHLYRIGLADHPNCLHCATIVETPEHLILNCPLYAQLGSFRFTFLTFIS